MPTLGICHTSHTRPSHAQALLYAPDRSGRRPALHTLVVDYSAVYGTDAPAVDTLVLSPDLAALLSPADHQQLMGRLRRDGAAVYPDYDALRAAVLGLGRRELAARREARQAACRRDVLSVLAPHVASAGAGTAEAAATQAVVAQLRALARPGVFGRHEVAALVLQAALCSLLVPLPELLTAQEPAGGAGGAAGEDEAVAAAEATAAQLAAAPDRELLRAVLGRLKRWGGLQPLELLAGLRLRQPGEQRRLVEALAELCGGSSGGLVGGGEGEGQEGVGVKSRLQRLLVLAQRIMGELADADVLEAEGLQAWLDRWGQPQHGGQQPLVAGAGGTGADRPPAEFVRDVREVAKYVGESSEEEEDE